MTAPTRSARRFNAGRGSWGRLSRPRRRAWLFPCGSAVSHWDAEDWDIAVGIVGQCSSLSEAQWREITESLPEPRCDAQTISKLAEIPGVVIKELHDAIEADRSQA